MMDHLWLTAPQHGTCNQKYDLFHNKISKFVFWRNCYWKPRQGNIYRNSFGKIYIRDKPKYLTLNSNNLNNYRYSEINNFFNTDYSECFDISPILDPSGKYCANSFSARCCKKYHIIRYDDIRVLCRLILSIPIDVCSAICHTQCINRSVDDSMWIIIIFFAIKNVIFSLTLFDKKISLNFQ